MNKKLNFKSLIKVVNWITISFKPDSGLVSQQALSKLIQSLAKLQTNRGPMALVMYCKIVRGNLMNYLSSNSERIPGCALTRDGIPVILGDLIPYIRNSSYLAIAMIFTILFSTRSLNLGKSPVINSIIQPQKGDVPNLVYYMKFF